MKAAIGDEVQVLATNSLLFDADGQIGQVDELLEEGCVMAVFPNFGRIMLLPQEFRILGGTRANV